MLRSHSLSDHVNYLLTAHAVKKFYNLTQGRAEPNDTYMERFIDSWNAAVASTGSVACLVPEIMKTSDKYKDLPDEERTEAATAMYFLYMLIG